MQQNEHLHTNRLDYFGRITIPEQIRHDLDWQHGDRMVIRIQDAASGTVIIRREGPYCSICHLDSAVAGDLLAVKNGYICAWCREEIEEQMAATLD